MSRGHWRQGDPTMDKERRKTRYELLEKKLSTALMARFRIGLALKEIRDDELYREEGLETFEKYCRTTFDLAPREALDMIRMSEARQAIDLAQAETTTIEPQTVEALTRLAKEKRRPPGRRSKEAKRKRRK